MTLLDGFDFPALRELLGKLGADGWLLYDFHGINPAATRVLGIKGMGTRRFFVLLPREGTPVAIAHRIELASFDGFPGEVRAYAAWRELHDQLRALVAGKTVAMEISPADAVPYLDRVPHGVVELIEGFGANVVSSGTLITRFAARWSASELEGHRRAAEAIAEIALTTLRWAGSELGRGACCCSISGPASRWAVCLPIKPGWGSLDGSRVMTCVVRGASCVMPGMQRWLCFGNVGRRKKQ